MKKIFLILGILLVHITSNAESQYAGGELLSELLSKGIAFYHTQEFDSAYVYFNTAVIQFPESDEAYFRRAMVKQHFDSIESANMDYEKAIALNPKPLYLNNLGINLAIKNRFQEAIEVYDKALKLEPDYAQAWLNRAAAYYYLDEIEKACSDAHHARELGLGMAQPFIETVCN